MHKKQLVILDVDGTVLDSLGVIYECYSQTFADLGRDYPGDRRIAKHIGTSLAQTFASFLEPKEVGHAVQTYREIYFARQNQGIDLLNGAQEAIVDLQEKGVKLAAFTMKLGEFTRKLLEDLQLSQYFEMVVGSEDVDRGKPSGEGIEKIIQRLNVKQDYSIFIGDSLHDAESAFEAHIDFIGVLTGVASEQDFKDFGVVTILEDLKAASDLILAS
jgi:HAD superfamily hydrolase (TIGR01549 family)